MELVVMVVGLTQFVESVLNVRNVMSLMYVSDVSRDVSIENIAWRELQHQKQVEKHFDFFPLSSFLRKKLKLLEEMIKLEKIF